MSDGNFNRSLLPHTPYQSGMQAGKSMARMYAIESFKEFLRETEPSLTNEEISLKAERFRQILSKKIQ